MTDDRDLSTILADLDADARRRFGHGIEDCTWEQLEQLRDDATAGAARAIHEYDQADAELRDRQGRP